MTTAEKTHLTCKLCNHTGPGVHQIQDYIGGHGYVWFVECDDRRACMRRQEERHAG